MDAGFWKWLFFSDAGLLLRIAIGVGIFVGLALWDFGRRGKDARRWREYLFLLAAALTGMAYGAVNNQVTVTVSWEYLLFGKNLAERVGYGVPPDMAALRLQAAWLGMKAGLAPGLLFGAAFLIANNPSPRRAQLAYRRLCRLMLLPVVGAAAVAVCLALAGRAGLLGDWTSRIEGWDASRRLAFMAAWGAHLGAYIGGSLGAAAALARIARARRKMAHAEAP